MDVFQLALAIGAAVTALIVINDRRALAWIGVGALDFLLCTLYQDAGWRTIPYPMITGMVDASVCLAIYTWGRFRWEMVLYRLFIASVLVSVLRLSGVIDTNYQYVTALEVVNWLALLWIGGSHILGRAADVGWLGNRSLSRLGGFGLALFEERRRAPFDGR